MAASGNLMTDVIGPFKEKMAKSIKMGQVATLLIGAVSILIALTMTQVLSLMLYTYAFMVSGLLVPVLMMLYLKKPSSRAAMFSMVSGGGVTLALIIIDKPLMLGLDPIFFGLAASLIMYILVWSVVMRKSK